LRLLWLIFDDFYMKFSYGSLKFATWQIFIKFQNKVFFVAQKSLDVATKFNENLITKYTNNEERSNI